MKLNNCLNCINCNIDIDYNKLKCNHYNNTVIYTQFIKYHKGNNLYCKNFKPLTK